MTTYNEIKRTEGSGLRLGPVAALLALSLAGCAGGDIIVGGSNDGGALAPQKDLSTTTPRDLAGQPPSPDLSTTQMAGDLAVQGEPGDMATQMAPADLSMSMMAAKDMSMAPPPDMVRLPDFSMIIPPDMAVPTVAVGAVIINEVNATNLTGITDEDGDNKDWIELYNTTAQPVDLTGVGLSNSGGSPYAWVFPAGAAISAHSYLFVWASNENRKVWGRPLHTNFSIDNGVDTIYLTAPGNVTLDMVMPARTQPDVSWCRIPDVTGTFEHCIAPTPNAANGGTAYPSMLTEPSVSIAGGFYAATQNVALTTIEPGASIHYTIDGSTPTINSPTYNAPIAIANRAGAKNLYADITTSTTSFYAPQPTEVYKATVLRAATFATGKLSSPVNTHTYFIDPNAATLWANIPVISVATNPPDYFSSNNPRGIFVPGPTPNGNWDSNANFWLPTKVASSIEYYNVDRTTAFRVDGDTQVAGGYSRNYAEKSMDVAFNDAYGTKELSDELFPHRTYSKIKEFRVRVGSEWGVSQVRDQVTNFLMIGSPVPFEDYLPAVHFVDGEYWGYIETREKTEADYLASVYGIDANAVDVVDVYYGPTGPNLIQVHSGNVADYNALLTYVTNNAAAIQMSYPLLQALVDPENLTNYFVCNMFVGNTDWLDNNVRMYHEQKIDGVWRWILQDDDFAFGFGQAATGSMYGFIGNGTQIGNLMATLLKNPTFTNLFINTVADQLNSYFTQTNMTNVLNGVVDQMQPILAEHYTRWHPNGHTIDDFNNALTTIRTFMQQREANFVTQTQQHFGLSNAARYTITVNANDLTMGNVKINTLDLTGRLTNVAQPWTGKYFPNVPITLTAEPIAGYKFVAWQGASNSNQSPVTLNLAANATITAQFAVDPNYTPPKPPVTPVAPAGSRNIALGVNATQSSTSGTAYASLAIDGDVSGDPNNHSIAITNAGANSWWQEDLGQQMNVFSLSLYTRTDCCLDQFADFTVFVSNADMTGRTYASLLSDASIWKYTKTGLSALQMSFQVNAPGRYVRVQLSSANAALSIAELQVTAVPLVTFTNDTSLLRNLALGKTATQSSVSMAGTAALAVDGNPDGNFAHKSTTLTNAENDAWWEVDLGQSHVLNSVELINRTDCCATQLANFDVFISNQPMDGMTLAQLNANANVWKYAVTSPVGTFIKVPSDTIGRYVRVELTANNTSLSLAEVVVMGLTQVAAP